MWIEKRSKRILRRLMARLLPGGEPVPLAEVGPVRSVLLVRPNFRMGNTLIATPLVPALRERFPGAELDFLAADTTASLLENLPLRRVITVSRSVAWNPVALLSLVRRLRRARYDLAVEGGRGSFSGVLLTCLAGARYRLGRSRWAGNLLNVRVDHDRATHTYDNAAALARALGVRSNGKPLYRVGAGERAEARELLARLDLLKDGTVTPYLGVVAGGHADKRWAGEGWIQLLERIDALEVPVVLMIGPEETGLGDAVRRRELRHVRVIPPRPVRAFAALCAESRLLLAPDTGPMHLAVALGVPTIALFQIPRSLYYRPRGPEDRVLMRPAVADVLRTLQAHPAWDALAGGRAPGAAPPEG